MVNFATSKQKGTDWKERFFENSAQAESVLFATFAKQIQRVQAQLEQRMHASVIRRAFHAKVHAGIVNAEFRVRQDIPEDLRIGLFQPATTYRAIVRFSNASGTIQSDTTKDLRGVALRVVKGQEQVQDFLMTDAPASHARDARQFMIVAKAMASRWKLMILPRLLYGLGIRETWRVIQALQRSSRTINSLAADQFWSRAPIKFGPYAVKFTLQPLAQKSECLVDPGENSLSENLRESLQKEPIIFDFRIQRFVDEMKTPIEDGAVEWKETDAPFETIAQLVIPQQDLSTDDARETEAWVNRLEFNPWNTTDEFRPLGNLNRARRTVYQASADYRSGYAGTIQPPHKKLNKIAGIALMTILMAGGFWVLKRRALARLEHQLV